MNNKSITREDVVNLDETQVNKLLKSNEYDSDSVSILEDRKWYLGLVEGLPKTAIGFQGQYYLGDGVFACPDGTTYSQSD